MKDKKESLSECIVYPEEFPEIKGWIDPKDVREAVKKLNNYFASENVFTYVDCLQMIKIIFGKELSE